jgi:cobalt-zinc-cadmium efflux system outer membrane protein
MLSKSIFFIILLLLASLITLSAAAQNVPASTDTLKMTIEEAEKQFLEKNLLLLAEKYNIDASRAMMEQARLWNNPTLSLEQNVYNQHTGEVAPMGARGQNIVQIEQLLTVAGKRNKRIKLEQINTEIAEHNFNDLMRTLRYELRSNFYDIYFLQQSLQMYDHQIISLQRTVQVYQMQQQRGNIPLKEVVRLKAFLFMLGNERKELKNEILERQAVMHTLLGYTAGTYIQPQADKQQIDKANVREFTIPQLSEIALQHRSDLKLYAANVRRANQNLALERANAVPDMRIGGVYDRAGSYINNYYGITLAMDLPVFNRNQGNIKAARFGLEKSRTQQDNLQLSVNNELSKVYQQALEADNLYKNFDSQFTADFNRMIEGMTRSYEKRNITLIEFIDFSESYRASIVQMNQLQTDRINALEQLNFYTGKNLFNY